MPYGLEKKLDTPENNAWMEKCVDSISGTNKRTEKPYTKGEKIAICKVQLKKKGSSEAYSEESIREQFYKLEDKIRDAISPTNNVLQQTSYGPYLMDIFGDYVIVEKGNNLYKVPYTMEGNDISFDWGNVIEVNRVTVYEPVGEAEKEVKTKVPYMISKDGGRVVTYGRRTIN